MSQSSAENLPAFEDVRSAIIGGGLKIFEVEGAVLSYAAFVETNRDLSRIEEIKEKAESMYVYYISKTREGVICLLSVSERDKRLFDLNNIRIITGSELMEILEEANSDDLRVAAQQVLSDQCTAHRFHSKKPFSL